MPVDGAEYGRAVSDETFETFCIKADYQHRPDALSFEQDQAGTYWTADRVRRSLDFQRDVYDLGRRLLRGSGSRNVLDVGCGPALKTRQLLADSSTRVVLLDQPSVGAVVRANWPGANFVPADLERGELDLGERFDLVICADVVEHLVDPRPCMRLIRRHLAKDGVAVISTPERNVVRGVGCTGSPNPQHVREWSRDEFRDFVRASGFRVVEQELLPQARLGPAERALRRLLQPMLRSARWHGCQCVVCRADDEALARAGE